MRTNDDMSIEEAARLIEGVAALERGEASVVEALIGPVEEDSTLGLWATGWTRCPVCSHLERDIYGMHPEKMIPPEKQGIIGTCYQHDPLVRRTREELGCLSLAMANVMAWEELKEWLKQGAIVESYHGKFVATQVYQASNPWSSLRVVVDGPFYANNSGLPFDSLNHWAESPARPEVFKHDPNGPSHYRWNALREACGCTYCRSRR